MIITSLSKLKAGLFGGAMVAFMATGVCIDLMLGGTAAGFFLCGIAMIIASHEVK